MTEEELEKENIEFGRKLIDIIRKNYGIDSTEAHAHMKAMEGKMARIPILGKE